MSVESEFSADDEDLFIEMQAYLARQYKKLSEIQPSEQALASLNVLFRRLSSRGFFGRCLQSWGTHPEKRAVFEAIVKK